MRGRNRTESKTVTPALEAIHKLARNRLVKIFDSGQMVALDAHAEIERTPVSRNKCGPFYEHFLPIRDAIVELLAESYRRFFKVALGQGHVLGPDPDQWAQGQLRPAIGGVLDWIRDWYILACDGANQNVIHRGQFEAVPGQTVSKAIPLAAPFAPPQSWQAPAWLFQIGLSVGVVLLKSKHEPVIDSEEKLSLAHTRLLLKGAKRAFRWELEEAIETVRNEETAAAAATPTPPATGEKRRRNNRKGWKERERLYVIIRQILNRNANLEGLNFCAELDKRHAPPLYDWTKNGESWLGWKAAWHNTALRRRIRRVRQEAMRDR